MTYTANLDQIEATLDHLKTGAVDRIQTGDVRYEQRNDDIAIDLHVGEEFGVDDLESAIEAAYLGNTRNRHGSKRYSIRDAGVDDPRGFYIDDIEGGFTAYTEPEDRELHLAFTGHKPEAAIEEAYKVAQELDQ
ncbi:MAG: hypothetical protein SV186_05845 [Candidatus Nanohaloarchaea archaeon]|nr:hypothetical protein [Candidatus Nanohaloarchaea archaeon]